MQFVCIETFKNQDAKAVDRCFQLMECDDVTLLQQWIVNWSDLIHFEILPVVPGEAVAGALASRL
jgi:hypothetical protein